MYVFHADPGHGWLTVETMELALLGISGEISGFSYRGDGVAFLEEDMDMSVFLQAKLGLKGASKAEFQAKCSEWWRKHVVDKSHESDCFVRRLPRYQGRL